MTKFRVTIQVEAYVTVEQDTEENAMFHLMQMDSDDLVKMFTDSRDTWDLVVLDDMEEIRRKVE